MPEHLYQTDSYIKEFVAMVTAVEGQAVTLDRTVFYPGGGGQPCDVGVLAWEDGTAQVVKARKQGDEVWHTLTGNLPPAGALRALRYLFTPCCRNRALCQLPQEQTV